MDFALFGRQVITVLGSNSILIAWGFFAFTILLFVAALATQLFGWRWLFRLTFGFWPTKKGVVWEVEQIIIEQRLRRLVKCFLKLSFAIRVAKENLIAKLHGLNALDTKALLARRKEVILADDKVQQANRKAENARTDLLNACRLANQRGYRVKGTPRDYLDQVELNESYATSPEASLSLNTA